MTYAAVLVWLKSVVTLTVITAFSVDTRWRRTVTDSSFAFVYICQHTLTLTNQTHRLTHYPSTHQTRLVFTQFNTTKWYSASLQELNNRAKLAANAQRAGILRAVCQFKLIDWLIDWSLLKHVTSVHATNITTVTMNQTTERKFFLKHRKIET